MAVSQVSIREEVDTFLGEVRHNTKAMLHEIHFIIKFE